MKISFRDANWMFNDKKFCDIGISVTTSEYGRSVDRWESRRRLRLRLFHLLAYHSRSVIARSASGKALNHQSQTPLNRGLTALAHPIGATLDDFATPENAGTETDLYGWSNG